MVTIKNVINGVEHTHTISDETWKMWGKDKEGFEEVKQSKPEAVAKAEQEAKTKAEAVAKADVK